MSLLSLCQSAATEAGFAAPSTIVGNTERTAERLLSAAKREGTLLSKRYDWTVLHREHTFTSSSSGANYPLPSDFQRFLDGSVWDRANYWQMRGPLSPSEWQNYKSGITSVGIRRRWRLRVASGDRVFSIDPTPTSSDSLVFEYVSNQWCEDASGTAQSQWAADTDVARIDELLVELGVTWRLLRTVGMEYLDARDEYEHQVELASARDRGSETLNLSGEPPTLIGGVNLPDTGFG